MLDAGPGRSSPLWQNYYDDEVHHDPLGHLLWFDTPSFLTRADGFVQNFLEALKEGFINYKQSKKSKGIILACLTS